MSIFMYLVTVLMLEFGYVHDPQTNTLSRSYPDSPFIEVDDEFTAKQFLALINKRLTRVNGLLFTAKSNPDEKFRHIESLLLKEQQILLDNADRLAEVWEIKIPITFGHSSTLHLD